MLATNSRAGRTRLESVEERLIGIGISKFSKNSGLTTGLNYSHSIVAGGLVLMSKTTRLMPFTLLMISLDTSARKS